MWRLLKWIAASWLIALGVPASAQADISFDLSQVDYYQDGALTVPDSEWGQFDLSYDPGASLQWFNVVLNPGSGSESWAVQNHPLLPSSLIGADPFVSTSYFGLGVASGTSLSSVDVLYSLSDTPLTATPGAGTLDSVGLGTSQNIINNGVPSGIFALNAPGASLINWNQPFANVAADYRPDMPNVVQELNFCGPGAAANSIHWLAQRHNIDLGQSLANTQTELAIEMGNNNNGNWDDAEVQGKLQFMVDHNLPFDVHYTGGVMLPTGNGYVDPNGNGTARRDGPITWEWLQQEFDRGQDIELMTNTHWVVMDGYLSWGNIHLFSYRDDPFQKGAATTAAQEQTINDRHTWTYFSNGDVNIGNGNEILGTAVAESFVPEPGSLLLMSLGFFPLATRRRRSKA
ncbi:MAG: PEP-CTERM sorting domain-containing protein, partial [Candidatus Omnitrophica bacterium]|nr:PEP-CTERM sorting domain-containing protein [Candidatus Omnitrophota bacterium]MBI2174250.1 PEP-CTERM sorting domain-containing protein [Candidatus Omnitrophota bacterium]